VLLIVLVSLIVAMAVLVSVARLAVAERKAWQNDVWQIQADWLAESGLERAAARLRHDPSYRGERWTIPAALLGGRCGGAVKLRVDAIPGRPAQRRVRAEADYPDDPRRRARRSRETILAIAHGEEKP
jgi:hypothetical protein